MRIGCGLRLRAGKAAKPLQRKLTSRSDVKARSAVLQLKKRHVEEVTCLPTERLATACWDFIVAKRTPSEAAPVLVFRPLQPSNSQNYQQLINMLINVPAAKPGRQISKVRMLVKAARKASILD